MESSILGIGAEHGRAFKQALARILSTQVAEFTFSEILDGLPTEESFLEFHLRKEGNPVFALNHTSLCPGAVQKMRGFRDSFDPLTRTLPPNASTPGHCRRLQIISYAVVNTFAASFLFQPDSSWHTGLRTEADRTYGRLLPPDCSVSLPPRRRFPQASDLRGVAGPSPRALTAQPVHRTHRLLSRELPSRYAVSQRCC